MCPASLPLPASPRPVTPHRRWVSRTVPHTFKLADIGEGVTECEVLRWDVAHRTSHLSHGFRSLVRGAERSAHAVSSAPGIDAASLLPLLHHLNQQSLVPTRVTSPSFTNNAVPR
ncbi:hypothetical protein C8R44DRAFT_886971 [Mycena epipterygia]|nr:hypothetical protein C8R44DRAFT_886971 [Mycena epipterygia]